MNIYNTNSRTDKRGHCRGVISVEASLVFPLFFFAMTLFLRLFLLILTELFVAKAVVGLSYDMAALSYGERAILKEKVTAPSLLCYPELFATLGQNRQIEDLRIICRDDEEKNVEVNVFYDFPLKAPGLPAFKVSVKQSFLIRTFIGIYDKDKLTAEDSDEKDDENTDKVYVTENGQVYHLSRTCSYLMVSVDEVSADKVAQERNSSGGKYYQCEKCKSSRDTGSVYITAYGNRYHLSAKCPSLFRNVKEISREEAGDRRPCSKCGGE